MGRPLVYDELMGATGWEKSLDDLREGAATSALRGINKALFHTTYDAIEGIPYPPVSDPDLTDPSLADVWALPAPTRVRSTRA